MEKAYNNSVFINCPFDDGYSELFYAIIFTTYRCGFFPRSSVEEDNALNNRLSKIETIIEECKYGIHDLSRTEININALPRFNMPFELGIFFGARKFGNKNQKAKAALVLERQRYLYQQFISDLNGIDTKAHGNNPIVAIRIVRDWLQSSSGRKTIDGHLTIIEHYHLFRNEILPVSTRKAGLEINNLTYGDYCNFIEEALSLNMG